MIRRFSAFSLCLVGLLSILSATVPRAEAGTTGTPLLEELIRSRISALNARVGVYAQHVPTGRQVAINADEPMNTASVIKIPIMILAYRDADAGLLNLNERYEVTLDDYRTGSGLIRTFTPGCSQPSGISCAR